MRALYKARALKLFKINMVNQVLGHSSYRIRGYLNPNLSLYSQASALNELYGAHSSATKIKTTTMQLLALMLKR